MGHAEVDSGGATLILSDELPESNVRAARTLETRTYTQHLHVDDADALLERAVAAGCECVRKPQDHFYGERSGIVRGPFGVFWLVGHAIEDVSPKEMQRRYTALFA